MSTLNLFPARVPIGDVNKEGRVIMSREFANALAGLFERVGGADGSDTSEIEGRTLYSLFDIAAPAPPEDAAGVGAYTLLASVGGTAPAAWPPDGGVLPPDDWRAAVSELARQVEQLQHTIFDLSAATPEPNYADYIRAYAEPVVASVDWTRPGAIGSTTPNSGAFTTLSASGAVALSPANANVVLAPTGTGVVTINPAALGTMDRVAIGGTTPAAAAFTTVAASSTVSAAISESFRCIQNDGFVSFYNTANTARSGYVQVNSAGTFNFGAEQGQNFVWVASGVTIATLTNAGALNVKTGFGCNSKTAQTAFALGAAAVDLPTVIILANNLRTMAINNGMGS